MITSILGRSPLALNALLGAATWSIQAQVVFESVNRVCFIGDIATDRCIPFVNLSEETQKLLFESKLFENKQEQVIEFTAPDTPGDNQYACTYPVHDVLVKGIMKVLQ